MARERAARELPAGGRAGWTAAPRRGTAARHRASVGRGHRRAVQPACAGRDVPRAFGTGRAQAEGVTAADPRAAGEFLGAPRRLTPAVLRPRLSNFGSPVPAA